MTDDALAEPVVEIEGLSAAYDGTPVLEDVDLTVRRGDHLAVVGPNGGGKTTLIKIILGLLAPRRGRVRVFGAAPARAVPRVGYVPQNLDINPGFPITVLEATLTGLGRRGIGFRHAPADRRRAEHAMARAGVEALAGRRMDALSGGERQRVLLARALISEPELLVFDEPTANVDPHGRSCFNQILEELGRRITLIVVSHDLSVTLSRITGVACVNRRVLFNPRPELTPAMLSLLYGVHEESCPMVTYLDDLGDFLRAHRPPNGHGHEGHGHD